MKWIGNNGLKINSHNAMFEQNGIKEQSILSMLEI